MGYWDGFLAMFCWQWQQVAFPSHNISMKITFAKRALIFSGYEEEEAEGKEIMIISNNTLDTEISFFANFLFCLL